MTPEPITRPCPECGQPFVVLHGNQRRHPQCAQERILIDRRSRDRKRGKRPPKRQAPPTPTGNLRRDFVLAFPEMKAQLDRVAPTGGRLRARDYQSEALEDLPSLGRHLR
jgi:hypothetical protein